MNNVLQHPSNIIGAELPLNPEQVLDYMVEVKLSGKVDPDVAFNRICETLQRIGTVPPGPGGEKVLVQNCHILHKRGRYYIAHYKFMYCLDGGENRVTIHDVRRQSKIIRLLAEWGMIKVVVPDMIVVPSGHSNLGDIKVVPHAQRDEWEFQTRYTMGQVLQAA